MISVIGMQTRPGHTPVPIAAHEAADTPTMLRVSIAERRVLEDNMAGLEDRLRERARKEAEQKVAASNKRLNRQDVLRLVVEEGIGASEAARRLGVTRETIANHLRRGVEYGEIVRVGRGKYAWADGKEAQTDVSEDRVREEIEKALDVAHENVSTMVEDLAHQIAEQGRKLSELAETVVKLQRDVSALDIDVQELQRCAMQRNRERAKEGV